MFELPLYFECFCCSSQQKLEISPLSISCLNKYLWFTIIFILDTFLYVNSGSSLKVMSTGIFCGLKPLLFGGKTSRFEVHEFSSFFPFNVFHLLSWWYDSCCREGIVPKWEKYNEFSAKFMFILSNTKLCAVLCFHGREIHVPLKAISWHCLMFPLVSFSSNSSKFPATSFWNCLII